jgi:uncharacterized MAPEG superfamily protein
MPFNLLLQSTGVDGFRCNNPDAFSRKLRRDNERLSNPDFLALVTIGSCTGSSISSISKLAQLYRIARLVLLVAHQTMRVK